MPDAQKMWPKGPFAKSLLKFILDFLFETKVCFSMKILLRQHYFVPFDKRNNKEPRDTNFPIKMERFLLRRKLREQAKLRGIMCRKARFSSFFPQFVKIWSLSAKMDSLFFEEKIKMSRKTNFCAADLNNNPDN